MLLRTSYSHTKNFLKKTIQSLKSYISGGYQRLPKTPPCNPYSCTRNGGCVGINATHFNANLTIKRTGSMKLKVPNLTLKSQENKKLYHGKDESSKCLVTRKLKELEMMDETDVDLVVDIEEVLRYYSRLTCPIYRDIIDKFFVDVYSGTFYLSRVENLVSTKRLIKI
ncbi:hypothetical protein HanRHA438_Chr12g0534121 [Helianthus annuus]|uniref:Uncharacterized protein n=1 Tax=Helianthus annuus TaxID=4232 RepID=A0A251SZ19_HELAN|nr:uncharacterized protein LOC110896233 [Helianthus annuus]KAF5776282.1 hypothetical protein HanXRQr2_Chr12g0522541 [Helianthus annuus]KAJ0488021.1 hypothetical protein HanHA300_Chr12g0428441 [Helianthus annuus]KAJ0491356.1 hypothetical protein HanIR_Chr12g0562941 [Helianthus annuus]KAJ0503828.1 hypothetical protein HanHA89_Chr12g0452671 [Helianthus annuus]KAJ0673515.1 hypothetical protein HanLR1_Chr12g0430041 [Helianthus annuus]